MDYVYFSKSKLAFYGPALFKKEDIPVDAVKISRERRNDIAEAEASGKVISSDNDGFPIAIDPNPPATSELLERAKDELRAMRQPMLDAVTGIGWRADRSGNSALADEAVQVTQKLLDITDDQAMNAASTIEEMRQAGIAAYRRIATSASAELAKVFKEITGA